MNGNTKKKGGHEEAPDTFVLPAGNPHFLYPPVQDLVLERDHSSKGVVYKARVDHWFTNGNGKEIDIKENKR